MQSLNYDGISTVINSLGGFVVQVSTALIGAGTFYIAWQGNRRIRKVDEKVVAVDERVVAVDQRVGKVEKNTDGVKTELMAMAQRANLAEGEIKGREKEGEKRDATAAIAVGIAPSPVLPVKEGAVPVEDEKVLNAVKDLGNQQDKTQKSVDDLTDKKDAKEAPPGATGA